MPDFDQAALTHEVRTAGPIHGDHDQAAGEQLRGGDAPAAQAGLVDTGGMLRLQQSAGNAAVTSLLEPQVSSPGDAVRAVLDSPGRALDASTASVVGEAVGRDVSGVQIHEGPAAAASARAVGADLYASGQHIVAPEGIDTRTEEGLFNTVHEFVHVGQQADGAVDGRVTDDGLKISDPGDRFEQEADTVASQAVSIMHPGG